MSYHNSPKIVTDNLVMHIDAGNSKSYKGEAATNLCLVTVTSQYGTDYPANILQSVNTTDFTYRGRSTKKIDASGQWNIYLNGSVLYTQSGSSTFVLSWKMKREDGAAPVITNGYIYTNSVNTFPSVTITAIDNGWYQCSCTYNTTSSTLRLTGFTTTQTGIFYIADWQVEIGTVFHPYVFGTRGTTVATGGGLYDLSGNSNHCTVTSTGINTVSTYGGGVACDGSSGYIELPSINNGINRSVDIVYRQINLNGGWGPLWRNDWRERIFTTSSTIINAPGTYYSIAGPVGDTNMVQICYTIDGLTLSSYRNGSLLSTDTMGGYMNQGAYSYRFGYQCGGSTCTNVAVEIYSVKFYNKGLTSSEVLQNFNATKRRYGL